MARPASKPRITRAVGPIQLCSKAYFRKKPIPSTMMDAPTHTIQRVPMTCSRFPSLGGGPARLVSPGMACRGVADRQIGAAGEGRGDGDSSVEGLAGAA